MYKSLFATRLKFVVIFTFVQVIELAGVGGSVDIEYNYMGKKRKALTAYFGDLVNI